MSNSQPEYLVGKFYTAARKFKQLIGQLPDGTVIPGGPYTLTQFVPALIITVLFGLKIWLLGASSLLAGLIQATVVLAIAATSIFLLGKLPPTRRSIFHLMSTTPALIFSNRNGYWAAQPIGEKKKINFLRFIPTIAFLSLFTLKLIIFGAGNFLLLQILAIIALSIATVLILRRMDHKEHEDQKTSEPDNDEPHNRIVTTTKTNTRPQSGMSRFHTSIGN